MSDADAESACEPSARQRLRRLASLAAWGVVAALLVTAVLILFVWSQTLPRATRRAIVEWLLRATLAGYAIAVCAAIGGLIVVVRMAWYRRCAKAREPGLARLAVLGFASLFALPIAESAAAIWLAWADRMPRLPIHFDPPDGREHLVVVGGSAALGHPYAPHVSVGQIAVWQLERAMPERNFQLDTLAKLSASLADMQRTLVDLKQRPTAIIIQSGHNEFPSRFDFERNVDLEEAPANRFVDTLYRASLTSALCRCIYGALNENRLDGPPPSMNAHRLIDAPMCTPSEAVSVLDSFQRRLEAIVAYSVQIGAVPVLVIEPSNEASFRRTAPCYPRMPPKKIAAGLNRNIGLPSRRKQDATRFELRPSTPSWLIASPDLPKAISNSPGYSKTRVTTSRLANIMLRRATSTERLSGAPRRYTTSSVAWPRVTSRRF
jgi:hypothetical protein